MNREKLCPRSGELPRSNYAISIASENLSAL